MTTTAAAERARSTALPSSSAVTEYFAAVGEPKSIWKVPRAKHTGGIGARPALYEQRVIDFLDGALLGNTK